MLGEYQIPMVGGGGYDSLLTQEAPEVGGYDSVLTREASEVGSSPSHVTQVGSSTAGGSGA